VRVKVIYKTRDNSGEAGRKFRSSLFKGLWGGGAKPHGLIFVQEVFGGLEPFSIKKVPSARNMVVLFVYFYTDLLYNMCYKTQTGGTAMRELKIGTSEENQRLDKFLLKYMNKAPKSFIYKMLRKKNIKLNGKKAEGNEMLKCGDEVKLFLADETINSFMAEKTVTKQAQDFIVKYEDENVLVVLKPAGLSVQPDKDNPQGSLNDQLLYYLYQKGEYDTSAEAVFKPSVCNRLDRNTAGLVVLGKNAASSRVLNEIFREKYVDKLYLTAVKGIIKDGGSVEGWHTKDNKNKASISKNKIEGSTYILTKYRPVKVKNNMTLTQVKLETGKSHQIRACMQYISHPVAGDRKYGDASVNKFFKENFGLENQLLFSFKLVFKPKEGSTLYYLNNTEVVAESEDLRTLKSYKKQNTAIADAIDYFLKG
jgi:23S rRNA pseudouridine955/2504/2580 synthase